MVPRFPAFDRFDAGKAAHHLQSSGCEGTAPATDVLHALAGTCRDERAFSDKNNIINIVTINHMESEK